MERNVDPGGLVCVRRQQRDGVDAAAAVRCGRALGESGVSALLMLDTR